MASVNATRPVFSVHPAGAAGGGSVVVRALTRMADALLGLDQLQRLYLRSADRPADRFVDRALDVLGVRVTPVGHGDTIPTSGPLVVVANHPQGALDGLAVASVLLERRGDVRILGNHVLARIPEVAERLIAVDVSGRARARRVNQRAMRDALAWLARGGCVCIFPSGEVAHRGWGARADEAAWQASAVRLARRARAPMLPITLGGSVGRGFRLAGRLHPIVRTVLLPRLLLAQRGSMVSVGIGRPLDASADDADVLTVTRELRAATTTDPGSTPGAAPAVHVADAVLRDVRPLLASQTLVSQGRLSVFWTSAAAAPALFERLGRAREAAFRAVGEGTGQDVDLDEFDWTYRHLCLWDHTTGTLAGAYRMGLADELVGQGRRLYTQTLFDYDARFLAALGPALELGRAFLVAPYQRQFAPLALLWSAIGRFVAAHPRYRSLFGAVSIDSAYGPAARHAMVTYLQQHASAQALGALVIPRRPPTADDLADARLAWAGVFATPDLTQLDAVVARLDPRRRGAPVLLRQYLKLDARVASFSIDPAFGHVLDALTVVDLPSVTPAMLRRFMGSAQAAAYRAHHDATQAPVPADPRRRA